MPSSHSLTVLATGQAAWGTVVFRAAGRLTNVSGQAERTMGVLNYHRPGHVVFCIGLVRRARLLLSFSFAEVPGQAAESLANARPITGGRTPSCARGQAAMDNRGVQAVYLAGCFHPVPATSCRVARVRGTRSARPTDRGYRQSRVFSLGSGAHSLSLNLIGHSSRFHSYISTKAEERHGTDTVTLRVPDGTVQHETVHTSHGQSSTGINMQPKE